MILLAALLCNYGRGFCLIDIGTEGSVPLRSNPMIVRPQKPAWPVISDCGCSGCPPLRKVAAILSVVESCRRLEVPVKKDLLAILPGMNQRKVSEVTSLTPARWNAARA